MFPTDEDGMATALSIIIILGDKMIPTDEDGMATALSIIIILGDIRRWINRNSAPRSCWVRPWKKKTPNIWGILCMFHIIINRKSSV